MIKFSFEYPIKATMFGNVTQKNGFWHNGHNAPNNLLVYCTKGSFKMRFLHRVYTVYAGDILIVPKDVFYQPLHSDGCSYYFFHFTATQTDSLSTPTVITQDDNLPDGNYAYSYFPQSEETITIEYLTKRCDLLMVNEIFERARRLNPYQNAAEKWILDALVKELLVLLSKEIAAANKLHPTLQKIVRYIREHSTEKLSIALLAQRFSLSESYIARLFKKGMSTRPSDFINSVRIDNACELLLHTDLPIENIAYHIGYSSPYYFSRVFKALRGCSPLTYRKNQILI